MRNNKHSEIPCTKHNSTNNIQLALWTLAWLVSTAFLRFGAEYIWNYQVTYSIYALILHLTLGFYLIVANIKHLANLDELQRKITMDAMGITLGVGLIVGIAYEQLEDIKLINFEPEISQLLILMSITYIIATIIGTRKYK
ncbi:MAG: hypothetical protein JKY14_10600 [Paraglaciecola sp.]|nr:hypothetical protein [Paraglaciecola sp.]